ncbi:MAG: CpsD/CapB family tyrosine-protein kinase [Firmicutes bacterium]|nr:CpsD/CapB family tyrosine-protein kinase [Bacillota bacterium]
MISNELITHNRPRSYEAESFRTLRANLQFFGVGRTLKALQLTGGMFGEGTSFVTANLAIVFAQTGRRVIVVDCDLRRPQQHLIFNVDNMTGLTSVLSGYMEIDEVLKTVPVTGVTVLTSGLLPANPTELLGSRKMGEVVAGLKEKADVILFDSPPLTVVADAAVLSNELDGVLLVVRSRLASRDSVAKAKEFLSNARANILGVALNSVRMNEIIEDYYSYYGEDAGKQKIIMKKRKEEKAKKPEDAAQ